jgi:hypothetical protein
MGCGGSKSSGGKSKKVDLKMEKTKIAEFDDVFDKATAPLGTLQEVHENIKKAEAALDKEAHCHLLKDHTFKDAVMLYIYSISAASNGDLRNADFKVTDKAPFIAFDKKKVAGIDALSAAFEHFIEKLEEVPKRVEPLED